MIARHWRGWTERAAADAYESLLREKKSDDPFPGDEDYGVSGVPSVGRGFGFLGLLPGFGAGACLRSRVGSIERR